MAGCLVPVTFVGATATNRSCEPREMAGMEDREVSVDEMGEYLGASSDTVYR